MATVGKPKKRRHGSGVVHANLSFESEEGYRLEVEFYSKPDKLKSSIDFLLKNVAKKSKPKLLGVV